MNCCTATTRGGGRSAPKGSCRVSTATARCSGWYPRRSASVSRTYSTRYWRSSSVSGRPAAHQITAVYEAMLPRQPLRFHGEGSGFPDGQVSGALTSITRTEILRAWSGASVASRLLFSASGPAGRAPVGDRAVRQPSISPNQSTR